MRRLRCLWGGILVGLAGMAAGCDARDIPLVEGNGGGGDTSTGEGGSGGDLFPTGGAGSEEPVCKGVCVPSESIPFERVTLVAINTPAKLPPCPESAPLVGFEGHADLIAAPHTCPECACSPAACMLPTEITVSAAKCPGSSAPSILWNPEPGWEGVCTPEGAIPSGLVCEGAPCVQSLTVGAPTVEPCVPYEKGGASIPSPSWGKAARECLIGPLSGDGCKVGEACAPAPPDGFSLCLFLKGYDPAYECPLEYPRQEVVFTGIQDARTCEPCECGEPEGADCAVYVSAYADGACGQAIAAVTVAPEQPACVDLLTGTALGSKGAELVLDTPGSCAPSGGAAVGSLQPAGAVTLCCQPDPALAE